MRLCFRFDARAWVTPPARHAVRTIAPLLDVPFRLVPDGVAAAGEEAVVWVGDPARAPGDAAARIAVRGWPDWSPAGLEAASFEGPPLLAPAGRVEAPGSDQELPEPWLRSLAYVLCREEERQDPRRDQWECYSGHFTRHHALGLLGRPIVNLQADRLAARLARWEARRGARLERAPRWKGGAPLAVALTHDVDWIRFASVRESLRLLRLARGPGSYAFRAGLAGLGRALLRPPGTPDPFWNFERWIGEESRRGFRSTFFFCPSRPSLRHEFDATYQPGDALRFEGRRVRVSDLARTLAERGFEIGLHGSYTSFRSAEELAAQRLQIERACGRQVRGLRQHFLRYDPARTPPAQDRAGLDYDSTLGYNEAVGFRAGLAAPLHPWDPSRGQGLRLLELPLTLMDGTLFRTLRLDASGAAARIREHLDEVQRVGGLAVLLWHPNAADERRFPGWWPAYLAALEELSRRSAWVTTAGGIAEWWRARDAALSPGEPVGG